MLYELITEENTSHSVPYMYDIVMAPTDSQHYVVTARIGDSYNPGFQTLKMS